MRIIVNIEGPETTVELHKEVPTGGLWSRIKLIKAFWNQQNISTNRLLLITIDECDADVYYTTTGGENIKYVSTYVQEEHYSIGELRSPTENNERWNVFKNKKVDNLTLKIYNYAGNSATDISSTNYLILEFELQ